MRNLPAIDRAPIPPGYATPLAWGWDSWQGTANYQFGRDLADYLDEGQARAQRLDPDGLQGAPIQFGGEAMQIWAGGSRGHRYVLENDDFQIHFRGLDQKWPITFRLLSGGLWEYGREALEQRIHAALGQWGTATMKDVHVTRADWCVDFYSPAFTGEMVPEIANQVVCHSSCKRGFVSERAAGVGRTKLETLYIGSRKSQIEIAIYDKGREIKEQSGKSWMREIYEANGYFPPDDDDLKDIWRVEFRFRTEYFKERGLQEPLDFLHVKDKAIAEACYARRLTTPKPGDSNKRRWPLHPLFSLCWELAGKAGDMPPLGRRFTEKREELVDRLTSQIAGTLRSQGVLKKRDMTEDELTAIAAAAVRRALADPEHGRKTAKAEARYARIDEAQ